MNPITFEFEKVSFAEAKRVHEGAPRKVADPAWTSRRLNAELCETIRQETVGWMRGLPDGARPAHLAEHFPRIANRICALWEDPVRCAPYLSDLLLIRRPAREGFPMAVANDIGNLTLYYTQLHPVGRPWLVAG
jgi:hypothetical protein